MVDRQLVARDITDRAVLGAMASVRRHMFVAPSLRDEAYDDCPLPIGHGQTISQPYIVALMTQLARPSRGKRALDIGTGCGYQAAVLAELCGEVHGVELVPHLAREAGERLRELGYGNVTVHSGDGRLGLPEEAPFDVIVVGAAPPEIPRPLLEQLAVGGRLVIPVGVERQSLRVAEKLDAHTVREWRVVPVRFVPLTGPPNR